MHGHSCHILILALGLVMLTGAALASGIGAGMGAGLDDQRPLSMAAAPTHYLLYDSNGYVLLNGGGKLLCNSC